jgi:hypothetical protein
VAPFSGQPVADESRQQQQQQPLQASGAPSRVHASHMRPSEEQAGSALGAHSSADSEQPGPSEEQTSLAAEQAAAVAKGRRDTTGEQSSEQAGSAEERPAALHEPEASANGSVEQRHEPGLAPDSSVATDDTAEASANGRTTDDAPMPDLRVMTGRPGEQYLPSLASVHCFKCQYPHRRVHPVL